MTDYDQENINRIKKIMIGSEDYWDSDLSVDFCIARRSRDILLGRKIVDDFIQTRTRGYLDFEIAKVWQDFFSEYVNNELQVAEFWSLFLNPSQRLADEYTKIDERVYPLLLKEKDQTISDNISPELRSGFSELLKLFETHMNVNFWPTRDDWNWFLFQYLKYLSKVPENMARDGLSLFLSNTVEMHENVLKSGWRIDYGLYENPLEKWGGQSLSSKFKNWIRTKKFVVGVSKETNLNAYSAKGFWELAIISTLLVAFFPWSLLFCLIFLGLDETKHLIIALFKDVLRTLFGIIAVSIIVVFFILFLFFIFY